MGERRGGEGEGSANGVRRRRSLSAVHCAQEQVIKIGLEYGFECLNSLVHCFTLTMCSDSHGNFRATQTAVPRSSRLTAPFCDPSADATTVTREYDCDDRLHGQTEGSMLVLDKDLQAAM